MFYEGVLDYKLVKRNRVMTSTSQTIERAFYIYSINLFYYLQSKNFRTLMKLYKLENGL